MLVPMSRPSMADYLLILFGLTLSLYFVALSGLNPVVDRGASVFLTALGSVVPLLLFLPLGVVLLWPLFFTLGKLAGRSQKLALGEWLWGFAWLVSLVMAIWMVWKASGGAPESLTSEEFRETLVAIYALYLLAMGVVAFFTWLFCLFSTSLFPWTHTFALALLFWPVLPLSLIWLMKWRVVFAPGPL